MIHVRPYPEFINVGIEPYHQSTWGTIVMLFRKNYYFAGFVLSTCSVVIPFFKCIGLLFILASYLGWIRRHRSVSQDEFATETTRSWFSAGDNWPPDLTRFIAFFSGYQFVDIFVGLLFLAFCNTPEVHSTLLAGYYFFLAYCILSTFVVYALLDEDVTMSSQLWKVEVTVVRANLLALVFLFALGFGEPMLDVAYTFHGLAMGRSRMGLLGMTYQLATYGHPLLGVFFILITVVIPVVLGLSYLLATDRLPDFLLSKDPSVRIRHHRAAMDCGNFLQKFAMTDIFCLALITFLFCVQGSHVTSSVPNGSFFSLFYTEWLSGFYVALGYGAAVFTLKWRALSPETDDSQIAEYYGFADTAMHALYSRTHISLPEIPLSSTPCLSVLSDDDDPQQVIIDEPQQVIIDEPQQVITMQEYHPLVDSQDGSRLGKMMRNPIFHIKLTSWIIWFICYVGIHAPPPLTFMSVNAAVNYMLPTINDAIEHSLPYSFGDCSAPDVPSPEKFGCVGNSSLYMNETSGSTRLTVRWASGLNTIRLKHVALQVIKDSAYPIQIGVQGVLEDMKASIKVENCLFGCHTLMDSADHCCGKHRTFDLGIASSCVDNAGRFTAASLGQFKVEWLAISSLTVSGPRLPLVSFTVADITPAVKTAVRGFLNKYLQGDESVSANGKSMFSFKDIVRRLWEYNINERRLTCEQMLQDIYL